MSNRFNKIRDNKKSVNIINHNMRMPEKRSDDKNPVTTIFRKSHNKNNNRKEHNNNKDEKRLLLQKMQERDLSKKAVKSPKKSPDKRKQNNIIKDNKDNNTKIIKFNTEKNNNQDNNNNKDNNNISLKKSTNHIKEDTNIKNNKNIDNNENNNNENDTYMKKLEKKLRESSNEKNSFNQKKEKKNDFLKMGINLDLEEFLDSNSKDKDKENNNNNNRKNNMLVNNLNPFTNINKFRTNNPNINIFQDDKSNRNKDNNEPYKLKVPEKLIPSDCQKRMSFNQNIIQNANANINETDKDESKSLRKKNTFQNKIQPNGEKNVSPFKSFNNIEKHNRVKSSTSIKSIKTSLKESLKRSDTWGKKSINSSVNNIIVPLLNRTKENNCFLNVIVQCLFHLGELKKDLLETYPELGKKSKTLRELYRLFTSYADEQKKSKENKNQIEPVLSVNDLRNYLNDIYHCYHHGETGDPMETLGYILDVIHRTFCKFRNINYKNIERCKCPSHQYFNLKLVDIISCHNCNVKKVQMYDKDCYMFNIFIKDLTNKLHGKSFNSYKLQLFSKLKEHNETYENENKIRIPGCNCNQQIMSLYEKKLKLNGPSSIYLIINITWAEQFPNMQEILKSYCLIPISDNIEKLFTFGEDLKTKINDKYYIKTIILYGIYHYVCVLYMKDQKKWAVIDDKTIKYISKYYDLIDFLLRNHLMPVGLVYSKERKDEISESEIKANSLSKEEYRKLYDFCKEVDVRRGLKISEIVVSKNSFNENNENYLNNNYFYKSVISFDDPTKNTGKKDNKKLYQNKDNNSSKKNIYKINKVNNVDPNLDFDKNEKKESKKNDFLKGNNFMGDFSDNNMKGGILILSSSDNDEQTNEKSDQAKEEKNFNEFGKKYCEDD